MTMIRSYIVRVETEAGEPDDLDANMREAAEWLAENIDPSGTHTLTLDVTDAEGNVISGYYYDPNED